MGVAWSTRQQFDASWDRGDTFRFGLGAGQVIKGWDEGVAGMKVGGRRRIVIPPHLGYGKAGAGGVIKGGETLVFVVDLLGRPLSLGHRADHDRQPVAVTIRAPDRDLTPTWTSHRLGARGRGSVMA